jgi:hypothetical protein
MDHIALALASLLVIWLVQRFKLIDEGKAVLETTRQAGAISNDPNLSDLEKEKQTQQAAKKLMGHFAKLLILGCAALILPILPLYLLSLFDVLNLGHILTLSTSIEFILLFCLICIVWLIKGKRV